MIHRRCLKDDGRGVSEALNETNTYNTLGKKQYFILQSKHFLKIIFLYVEKGQFRKLDIGLFQDKQMMIKVYKVQEINNIKMI